MTIPAVKCSATAKRSGHRCRRWAIAGATVCQVHGGAAPQVQRKAAERVALAEALARGDRRPAWQILLDATHTADVLMRQARVEIEHGQTVTPELLDQLVGSTERAARLAKVVLDAKVDQQRVRVAEEQGQMLALVITAVLGDFGLNTAETRVREVVARRIGELTGAGEP